MGQAEINNRNSSLGIKCGMVFDRWKGWVMGESCLTMPPFLLFSMMMPLPSTNHHVFSFFQQNHDPRFEIPRLGVNEMTNLPPPPPHCAGQPVTRQRRRQGYSPGSARRKRGDTLTGTRCSLTAAVTSDWKTVTPLRGCAAQRLSRSHSPGRIPAKIWSTNRPERDDWERRTTSPTVHYDPFQRRRGEFREQLKWMHHLIRELFLFLFLPPFAGSSRSGCRSPSRNRRESTWVDFVIRKLSAE